MNDDLASLSSCGTPRQIHGVLAQTVLGQWIFAGVAGVVAPSAGRAGCSSLVWASLASPWFSRHRLLLFCHSAGIDATVRSDLSWRQEKQGCFKLPAQHMQLTHAQSWFLSRFGARMTAPERARLAQGTFFAVRTKESNTCVQVCFFFRECMDLCTTDNRP